jgi:hypothetical protein
MTPSAPKIAILIFKARSYLTEIFFRKFLPEQTAALVFLRCGETLAARSPYPAVAVTYRADDVAAAAADVAAADSCLLPEAVGGRRLMGAPLLLAIGCWPQGRALHNAFSELGFA